MDALNLGRRRMEGLNWQRGGASLKCGPQLCGVAPPQAAFIGGCSQGWQCQEPAFALRHHPFNMARVSVPSSIGVEDVDSITEPDH